jgi:GNAT superfamily N-acetyltransferase
MTNRVHADNPYSPAPPTRDADRGERLSLRDGSRVLVMDLDGSEDGAAVAATTLAGARDVGFGQYRVFGDSPHAASVEVRIDDEWRGRGLGRALLKRLAERAHAHGIRRFTALIPVDNVPMLALLHSLTPKSGW